MRPLSVGLLDLGRDPASTETLPSRVCPGRWLRNAARCCAAVSAWRLLELPLLRDAARRRGLRAFIALRDVCVRRRVIFGAVSYITSPRRVRAARAALLHQLRAERGGRAEPSTSIATASGCPCPSEHVACSGPPTVKCRVSCVRAGWWCCGSGCAVCPLVPCLSGRCPQNMAGCPPREGVCGSSPRGHLPPAGRPPEGLPRRLRRLLRLRWGRLPALVPPASPPAARAAMPGLKAAARTL